MKSNEFIKKISVAFLERKPQFIETDNPYTAAKFYKDLADSDFSLYTKTFLLKLLCIILFSKDKLYKIIDFFIISYMLILSIIIIMR